MGAVAAEPWLKAGLPLAAWLPRWNRARTLNVL
jgi:hypothetical protein